MSFVENVIELMNDNGTVFLLIRLRLCWQEQLKRENVSMWENVFLSLLMSIGKKKAKHTQTHRPVTKLTSALCSPLDLLHCRQMMLNWEQSRKERVWAWEKETSCHFFFGFVVICGLMKWKERKKERSKKLWEWVFVGFSMHSVDGSVDLDRSSWMSKNEDDHLE